MKVTSDVAFSEYKDERRILLLFKKVSCVQRVQCSMCTVSWCYLSIDGSVTHTLYGKLLCLQIWMSLRLQHATSVIWIVWQFTYLSIFFYPEKVAEQAIFCTILLDKHPREQPTAATSGSCKVNMWDKNITFPVRHPSWSSGELHLQSCSRTTAFPTFQDTTSSVTLKT